VVDLAVGVVIGAAFGKIVTSLVDNIIMPPIGFVIGGIDFSELVLRIGSPVTDAKGVVTGGVILKYGVFLNTVLQFVIIAIAIFLVVQLMNRLIRKEEAAPAPPSPEVQVLTEIRDVLKARQ
jgi:large conductance mechanosensitive channel